LKLESVSTYIFSLCHLFNTDHYYYCCCISDYTMWLQCF